MRLQKSQKQPQRLRYSDARLDISPLIHLKHRNIPPRQIVTSERRSNRIKLRFFSHFTEARGGLFSLLAARRSISILAICVRACLK